MRLADTIQRSWQAVGARGPGTNTVGLPVDGCRRTVRRHASVSQAHPAYGYWNDGRLQVVDDVRGSRSQGAEMILYRINGESHTRPGTTQWTPHEVVGRTTMALRASNIIWCFFERHQRAIGGGRTGA